MQIVEPNRLAERLESPQPITRHARHVFVSAAALRLVQRPASSTGCDMPFLPKEVEGGVDGTRHRGWRSRLMTEYRSNTRSGRRRL